VNRTIANNSCSNIPGFTSRLFCHFSLEGVRHAATFSGVNFQRHVTTTPPVHSRATPDVRGQLFDWLCRPVSSFDRHVTSKVTRGRWVLNGLTDDAIDFVSRNACHEEAGRVKNSI
jgi:hypothetical protein